MKKLMILVAAVAIATVTQAASVAWSMTSAKDETGASMGGSALYTCVLTFWADNAGAVGSVISTTGLTDTTAAMSKYAGTTGDSFAGGSTYWVQAVLSKNDGTAKLTSSVASFTLDASPEYTINLATGAGMTGGLPAINFAKENWQTTSTPEPTSGLLLLLGMAGLALKRKVA